jgi:hypothetical protein
MLTGYLRGVRPTPSPAPLLCNISYFSLFLALFLFFWSGLSRLLSSENKPEEPQAYLKKLGDVGPFPIGQRTLCEKNTTEAACRAQAATFFDRLGIAQLAGEPDLIVLVGSADRRQLKARFLKSYDSNAGLARARAEWVQQELLVLHPSLANQTRFLSLYEGPRSTTPDASEADLDADREVQVWAIRQVRSPSPPP